jgi:hypothetical protein
VDCALLSAGASNCAAPDWHNLAWLIGNLAGAPHFRHAIAVGLTLFAVPLAFLA